MSLKHPQIQRVFVLVALSLIAPVSSCARKSDLLSNVLSSTSNKGSSGTCNIPRGVYPRPSTICGEPGYQYLWTVYLRPTCYGCHSSDFPVQPVLFADANLATAYQWAQTVPKDTFIQTTTKNNFIDPGCDLTTSDQIYIDLMTWIDNKYSCP